MARETSKAKLVNVGEKLRKTNPWFEDGAKKAKEGATEKKRIDLRASGSKLTATELRETADELEQIQRKLNELEARHKELSGPLLAHWAHTGIEEVESELGKTLVALSFKLGVDPAATAKTLTETQWRAVTERRINPQFLLAMAEREPELQPAIVKSIRASVSVKITPPSSRRPKSGQPEEEDEA